MENMFSQVLATAKKISGEDVTTGSAAVANAKERQPRVFIADTMLAVNDIVEIPTIDGSVPDDLDRWLDAPVFKGGDPVFGPLALVTSTLADGTTRQRAQRVFLGQFLKELRDRETSEFRHNTLLDKDGKAITFDDCADQFEQWSRLAGRKFRVTSIVTVKTQKRSRRTMMLYDADGTLTNFQEV